MLIIQNTVKARFKIHHLKKDPQQSESSTG